MVNPSAATHASSDDDLQFRLLNSKPFVAVGFASYSIYLWQQPFLYPFEDPSLLPRFPLNVVIVAVAALGSYFLVERPLRTLAPKPRPSPGVTVSVTLR